jgi:hypothetical protein
VTTDGNPQFPVVDVNVDPDSLEPIGSKKKFWFRSPFSRERWLFKEARPRTGEDWAEKIAAEVAELLELPHARVELARHRDNVGIVTQDFTELHERWQLVHGNELLFELDPSYPRLGAYRVHQHTLEAVRAALSQAGRRLPEHPWPNGVTQPWDGFVGYLLLDALIGNTDRHHQNWGLLAPRTGEPFAVLAPTFDHASSLGRELDDENRNLRLTTRDSRAGVSAYAAKARAALYDNTGTRPLRTIEAFAKAAETVPDAGRAWLQRLERVTPDALRAIVSRVPGPTMSDPARRFALALVNENRMNLLSPHV